MFYKKNIKIFGYGLSFFMMLVLFSQPGFGATLRLAWDANTEGDLAGYKVYYGTSPGNYGPPVDVGLVIQYDLDGLSAGSTYYIAVSAYDTTNYESLKSDEITYFIPLPPDTENPQVSITSPTSSSSHATSENTLSLGGTSSDNEGVTSVTWTNSRGGSGTASGTANWSVSAISLEEGSNIITVTGRDGAENTGSDTLTVTYTAPDTENPQVSITSPTSSSSHATSENTLSLGGTSSDNEGVTSVTWTNSRGGSGTASGTANWSVSAISLEEGSNIITVTGRDGAENTGSDTLTVTYTAPDTENPQVSITSPTSSSSHATSEDTLSLGGMASDNEGVTSVTWTNSRGGSGTASGTENWEIQGGPIWRAEEQTGDNAWADSSVTYCVRLLMEAPHIAEGANAIILSFRGRSPGAGDYSLKKVSIAEKDTTEGNVVDSTWTKVTFDQQTTANWASYETAVSEGSEKLSNVIPFSMDKNKDYYVTFKIVSPAALLNSPASYGELYFNSGDQTEELDWNGLGYTKVRYYHAFSGVLSTGIALHCGENNVIQIIAEDDAGNTGSDTLTINVKPCVPVGLSIF